MPLPGKVPENEDALHARKGQHGVRAEQLQMHKPESGFAGFRSAVVRQAEHHIPGRMIVGCVLFPILCQRFADRFPEPYTHLCQIVSPVLILPGMPDREHLNAHRSLDLHAKVQQDRSMCTLHIIMQRDSALAGKRHLRDRRLQELLYALHIPVYPHNPHRRQIPAVTRVLVCRLQTAEHRKSISHKKAPFDPSAPSRPTEQGTAVFLTRGDSAEAHCSCLASLHNCIVIGRCGICNRQIHRFPGQCLGIGSAVARRCFRRSMLPVKSREQNSMPRPVFPHEGCDSPSRSV